jgi:hypothetical protein
VNSRSSLSITSLGGIHLSHSFARVGGVALGGGSYRTDPGGAGTGEEKGSPYMDRHQPIKRPWPSLAEIE